MNKGLEPYRVHAVYRTIAEEREPAVALLRHRIERSHEYNQDQGRRHRPLDPRKISGCRQDQAALENRSICGICGMYTRRYLRGTERINLQKEHYTRRKELTSDSYAYPSNVQWGQIVAKDYRRDHDSGDLLSNTSDGHRNNPCPFDDAGSLQGGYKDKLLTW